MNKYPEPTVGALILNSQNKILLVKSHKWHNKYVIPGGHIELGEKMEDTLKREIKEETNLDIYGLKFLSIQEFVFGKTFWKKKHFIFINFYCSIKGNKKIILNEEAEKFQWCDIDAALKLDLEPATRKTIIDYKNIKNRNI